MKKLSFYLNLIFLATFLLSSGCGEETDKSATVTIPTIENDGGTTTEVGTVINDGFWIGVVPDSNWNFFMHKDTALTDSCYISKDTAQNEDITCTLNIPEGNIYVQDIDLHINIPQNMCRYLQFNNYWYYNFESGRGPTSVYVEETQDVNGSVTGRRCAVDANPLADCSTGPFDEFWGVDSGGDPICVYDYKSFDDDAPNCCTGSYSFRKEIIGPSPSDNTTDATWGETIDNNCLNGPARRDSGWPKSESNYPISRVDTTWTNGWNEGYTVQSTISLRTLGSSNVATASEYDPANAAYAATGMKPTTHWGGTYVAGVGYDQNGTEMRTAQDTYEFKCLDEGYETLQRIRVHIKDWNTQTEFLDYSTNLNASANPDVGDGGELENGTDCEYSADPTGLCNDFFDWDDLSGAYPQELWE